MWCKSTSRALTCLPLILCASLVQAQQQSPYEVTYGNGVTLEVISVSMTPTRYKPFWDPSGTKLLERPYDARELAITQTNRADNAAKAETIYEVVVRITGVKDNKRYLQQRGTPEISLSYPTTPFANGRAADDLAVYQLSVPKDMDVVEFEVGIAANTWQLVRAFTGVGVSGEGPARVQVSEPDEYMRSRYKDMHYFARLAPSEDALRVVAVDQEGATHISNGAWWMGGQEHSLEVRFADLAKEKVKEYRIEKAAYEWKSLKAIHLRPPGDWPALVRQHQIDRLTAQEQKFDPAEDQPRIEEAIDKISRTRAFEDSDTWVGAIRDLAEIGPPAIPSIIAEIQQTARPYARSGLAIALRAINDPRAVPGLADGLASSPFAPNDYGGGTTKDPALLHFMLDIDRGGGYRDERGPTYSLGRPVNEITYTLEALTGFKVPGRHQMTNERGLYEDAAAAWRDWWGKNKAAKTQGLPTLRTGKKDLWTSLHLAIAEGRTDEAEKLVAGGADVGAPGYARWTPLHLACAMQQLPIARLLLEKGASIKAITIDGCTPLHVAAGLGPAPFYTPLSRPDVKLINLLIEKGADLKAIDRRGKTALHGAVARGDLAVVELLLDVGVPVDAKDSRGRTALHRAVECGDEKIVDALLAAGADVNAKDADGRMPIRFASYSLYYLDFNPPTVAKLLAKGADVDLPTTIALGTVEQVAAAIKRNPKSVNEKAKTDDERLPLQWAVARKSPEMIKLLLDAGADPNGKEKSGNTAVHTAVFMGDKDVLAALIAAKADVNIKGQGKCLPLYWACSRLNVEIVDQLLAAGATPNTGDPQSPCPLSAVNQAVSENDRFRQNDGQPKMPRAKRIMEALIAHGADVNEKHSIGFTPIFGAPRELAQILFDHGAKLDVVNDEGNTPLHYSAVFSREDLMQFLLDHNVPLEPRNKKGQTPLHMAVSPFGPKGNTLKLLLDKGADLKARDKDGCSPLHLAVQQGAAASVTELLEKGADIEAKDNEGATPLHHAAKGGREQLILLLLKRGAIIDSVDLAGKTPLQWATSPQAKKLLIAQGAGEPPAK